MFSKVGVDREAAVDPQCSVAEVTSIVAVSGISPAYCTNLVRARP